MDYRSRRALERLLGDLDQDRELERRQDRQVRIRQAEAAMRFESAKEQLLRPAVRDVMARLEKRGHHARLLEPKPTKLRLEVVLNAATPVGGLLEVELDATQPQVCFRARRLGTQVGEHALALDRLSESSVAEALVEMLRALTAPSPPVTGGRPW